MTFPKNPAAKGIVGLLELSAVSETAAGPLLFPTDVQRFSRPFNIIGICS